MARSNFGGSDSSALAIAAPSANAGLVKSAPNLTGGTAWSASTGGTQYTDLIVPGGGATTVCTDADGYIVVMQGPDGVNEGMWVDLGSGRFYLRTTDGLNATFARPKTGLIAFVGDSITANGQVNMGATSAIGYAPWSLVASGHALTNVNRDASNMFFASGGYTTADMITAGYHTLAAATAASIVVVHAGTNDIGGAVTAAATLTGLQTIWNVLLAAGKTVVATTILPRNIGDTAGITAQMHELNHLIRQYVPTRPGMVLCDWANTVLDADTGTMSAACTSDGIHLNTVGGSRAGAYLGAVLADLVGRLTPPVMATLGVRGITPNPFATGNVAGLPTSWAKYDLGTPTSVTLSKVPRTDGIGGQWAQAVVVTAAPKVDGVQFQSYAGSGYAIGDQIQGVVEFETDAAGFDCRAFSASAYCNGSGASGIDLHTTDRAASTASIARLPSGFFVTPVFTIPPTPASTNVQINVYFYGSGTIRVSRMQTVKVN